MSDPLSLAAYIVFNYPMALNELGKHPAEEAFIVVWPIVGGAWGGVASEPAEDALDLHVPLDIVQWEEDAEDVEKPCGARGGVSFLIGPIEGDSNPPDPDKLASYLSRWLKITVANSAPWLDPEQLRTFCCDDSVG